MEKTDIAFIIFLLVLLPVLGFVVGTENQKASYCKYEYSYDLGKCMKEVKDE